MVKRDLTAKSARDPAKRPSSITFLLTVIAILMLLVPVVAASIIALYTPTLQQQVYEELESIADLQLESF